MRVLFQNYSKADDTYTNNVLPIEWYLMQKIRNIYEYKELVAGVPFRDYSHLTPNTNPNEMNMGGMSLMANMFQKITKTINDVDLNGRPIPFWVLPETSKISIDYCIEYSENGETIDKGITVKLDFELDVECILVVASQKLSVFNRRIFISCDDTNIPNGRTQQYVISHFVDMAEVEFKRFSESLQSQYLVYKNVPKVGEWRASNIKTLRSFENLILPNATKQCLIKDLDRFKDRKMRYEKLDIPYSRGYLFKGPPGTGKTSCARAIAKYTGRKIYYLMLSQVASDSELNKLLSSVDWTTNILIIEDIDCSSINLQPRKKIDAKKTKQKEKDKLQSTMLSNMQNWNDEDDDLKENPNKNITLDDYDKFSHDRSGLTLGNFLNVLDGLASESYGRILIITTNNEKDVDRAVFRPGRIDVTIEFQFCDWSQIVDLMNYTFEHPAIDLPYPEKEVPEKITPAEVISFLFQYDEHDIEDVKRAWNDLVAFVTKDKNTRQRTYQSLYN